MIFKILYLVALAVKGIHCYEGISQPILKIQEGKLKGTTGINYDRDTIFKFLGIPYAKPPLNELRFKEPQPVEPWTDTKDAIQPGGTCYSIDDLSPKVIGTEDCLYLNVYMKNLPKSNSTLKPVMVFIHGGGLVQGTSHPRMYGPESLLTKDIVFVSFDYRLALLGFLSISDPKLGIPGNLGLKDQNFALKWVQRNIESFGGDPNNVTIFGNSAGSASVHAHILSPASRGLFHRAIMQSGTALNAWFWGSKDNVVEIAREAGRNVSSQEEALEILRRLSVEELFAAQGKIQDSPFASDRRAFAAVREYPNPTAFFTENPVEIIEKSEYNHVPILTGYNTNEGLFAEDLGPKWGVKFVFQRLVPINLNVTVGSEDYNKILEVLERLYKDKLASKGVEHYDALTDTFMLVGVVETIRQHLMKNLQEPIYVYRMSLAGELNFYKRLTNRTEEPGAIHQDEIGYLFHSDLTVPFKPGSLEDRSVRNFVNLWTNFAIHGNPVENMAGVVWKPVGRAQVIKVLDIGEGLQFIEMPEQDRMEVWEKEIIARWPLVKFP